MNETITDKTKPYGIIRFMVQNGKERSFYSVVNDLTGDRLSGFDTNPPSVNDSISWVKSVFRDIRKKTTVLNYAGTKEF